MRMCGRVEVAVVGGGKVGNDELLSLLLLLRLFRLPRLSPLPPPLNADPNMGCLLADAYTMVETT